MPLTITIRDDAIFFGDGFSLNFERTLRIPDDGKTYPLPPGMGRFPIKQVQDYAERVPEKWRERGGVFIPMYQREAMWIRFTSRHWKPNAVKIGVGRINAISGEAWDSGLKSKPQNYLVCPPQLWLDGINSGGENVRQFVAMPLGEGYTVEGQISGKEEFGGLQMIVYEAKPGKFPDEPPQPGFLERLFRSAAQPPQLKMMTFAGGTEMGLGAGGQMRQKIYPDPHGTDTWDTGNLGEIDVHIVNSLMYQQITGEQPPVSPISAESYSKYGFPWFDLYDEQMGDVEAVDNLKGVKSVRAVDQEKGLEPQQDDQSVEVKKVVKYDLDQVTKPEQQSEND